jgi:hypothetical protein
MMEQSGNQSSSLYHIEPLKEDNWIPWKIKIESILDDRGLDGYIDGAKPKPVIAPEHMTEEGKAYITKWEAEDKKARTTIKLLVHDTQAIHLSGVGDIPLLPRYRPIFPPFIPSCIQLLPLPYDALRLSR